MSLRIGALGPILKGATGITTRFETHPDDVGVIRGDGGWFLVGSGS